jgi:exonuclease III
MKSHKETALFFTDLQFSETIVRFLLLLTSGVVRILIRFETLVPRGKRKGGGVAIVHSNAIKLKPTPQHTAYTHFEFMTRTVSANNHHFHLCVVYRPPPSKGNQYKTSTFFEEWSEFLDNFVITQGELLITGDLNFHLDDSNDIYSRKLIIREIIQVNSTIFPKSYRTAYLRRFCNAQFSQYSKMITSRFSVNSA